MCITYCVRYDLYNPIFDALCHAKENRIQHLKEENTHTQKQTEESKNIYEPTINKQEIKVRRIQLHLCRVCVLVSHYF